MDVQVVHISRKVAALVPLTEGVREFLADLVVN